MNSTDKAWLFLFACIAIAAWVAAAASEAAMRRLNDFEVPYVQH